MDRYYWEDLAYIHDAGFGDFARAASPGVLEILRLLPPAGSYRRIGETANSTCSPTRRFRVRRSLPSMLLI
jgi:hypothetical protein